MTRKLSQTIVSTTDPRITVKVYRDAEWQEWQCVPFVDGAAREKGTYHTDDKGDALQTARTMADTFKA